MNKPFVSCIMPTANRQRYVPYAINYFLEQDYENAELIIIDDGKESVREIVKEHPRIRYYYFTTPLGTIGVKRNCACEKACGELILHWDDDDWYAPDWISRQVEAHQSVSADITGLNRVIFFSPSLNKKWIYEDTETNRPWLCGATMAYKRSFWQKHPFIDLQVGEDYDFVWNSGAKVAAFDYIKGFTAILHPNNTSIKPIENPKHKKNPTTWVEPTKEETKSTENIS